MSHYLNRSTVKTPMAEDSITAAAREQAKMIQRHKGTTRVPSSRVLKPPIA